jgi:hypothetical protein
MIWFKILLPRFDNDGRPVEREKFLQTDDVAQNGHGKGTHLV